MTTGTYWTASQVQGQPQHHDAGDGGDTGLAATEDLSEETPQGDRWRVDVVVAVAEVNSAVVGDLLDLCSGQGFLKTRVTLPEGLECGSKSRPKGDGEIR